MDYDQKNAIYELMDSEQLNTFVVVEKFCNECEKETPHHIDESKAKVNELTIDCEADENFYESAVSKYECVFCRENDEAQLY